jgi:hypothetical protein
VTKQHSARGTLTSRAKEAMFSIFGENVLPPIKNNSTPSEILDWKKNQQVAECYKNLFEPINDDSDQLVMSRIIEKIFLRGRLPPNVQIAYVIAVCTTMLSSQYEKIMVNKKMIKSKMARYLVGFLIYRCNIYKNFIISQVFVANYNTYHSLRKNSKLTRQ